MILFVFCVSLNYLTHYVLGQDEPINSQCFYSIEHHTHTTGTIANMVLYNLFMFGFQSTVGPGYIKNYFIKVCSNFIEFVGRSLINKSGFSVSKSTQQLQIRSFNL